MYTLLIADDEETIRNALVNLVDWQSIGFEITGVFEDGRDVIEYLKRDDADAVLTDIRMFNISGLEVARFVRTHKPHIQVCLISGYQDFQYAREALELRVHGYILKPIIVSELIDIFKDIRRTLDNQDNLPFSFLTSADWAELKSCVEAIAQSVVNYEPEELKKNHYRFFWLIDSAEESIVFLAITILFESIIELAQRENFLHLNNLFLPDIVKKLHNANRNDLPDITLKELNYIAEILNKFKQEQSPICINHIKAYIDKHLEDNISPKDIAEILNYNPSYLSRRFKEETGYTLIEYIALRRIEKAKSLLLTTRYTAKEIASMVGYQNEKYFYQCFKEIVGCTTQEYKQKPHAFGALKAGTNV